MLSRIEHLITTRQYEEAAVLCRDELSRNPSEPRALYFLAVVYYKGEKYAEATQALQQLIDNQPADIDALLLLARIYSWGYGDGYSKAVDLYRRVLSLNSKEIAAYIGLALTRSSPGVQISIEESIQLLEQALAIDPSRPETLNNLAYAHWEAGGYQKAKEYFEKLLKIADPSTQPVIQKELQAIHGRQRPQNMVYLGPSLPLVD